MGKPIRKKHRRYLTISAINVSKYQNRSQINKVQLSEDKLFLPELLKWLHQGYVVIRHLELGKNWLDSFQSNLQKKERLGT